MHRFWRYHPRTSSNISGHKHFSFLQIFFQFFFAVFFFCHQKASYLCFFIFTFCFLLLFFRFFFADFHSFFLFLHSLFSSVFLSLFFCFFLFVSPSVCLPHSLSTLLSVCHFLFYHRKLLTFICFSLVHLFPFFVSQIFVFQVVCLFVRFVPLCNLCIFRHAIALSFSFSLPFPFPTNRISIDAQSAVIIHSFALRGRLRK